MSREVSRESKNSKQNECQELKNIQYKTMLLNGKKKSLEFDIYTIKSNYSNNKIYFGKNPSTIYDIYSFLFYLS